MNTRWLLSVLLLVVAVVAGAKTVVLTADAPLAEQMKEPNTTYVLSGKFDLRGKTLALPANAKFSVAEGGCIYNGKVTGTLKNKQVDIRWFGASSADSKYNAEAIENAARVGSLVLIPNEAYVLTRAVQVQAKNVTLQGEGKASLLKVLSPMRILDVLPESDGLTVQGVSFQGVGSKKDASYLIYVQHNSGNVRVTDCVFDGGTGGILVDYESHDIEVGRCVFRNMVYIPGAGLAAGGNYAAGGAGGYGVVFQQMHVSQRHPQGRVGVTNGSIHDCVFEATVIRHAVYVQTSTHIKVYNNTIYGTTEMNDKDILTDLLKQPLTDEQFRRIDVKKHTTAFDVAMCFRGCEDVLVRNNTVRSGLGFIRGTTDKDGRKGTRFVVKGNRVEEMLPTATDREILNLNFVTNPVLSKNRVARRPKY